MDTARYSIKLYKHVELLLRRYDCIGFKIGDYVDRDTFSCNSLRIMILQ